MEDYVMGPVGHITGGSSARDKRARISELLLHT